MSMKKTAQEIQDEIIDKMTTDERLAMVDSFFALAKTLNPSHFEYGTKRGNKSPEKSGVNSRQS